MVEARESDLVAVRLPPGPGWVDVLSLCWARGAAVLPLPSGGPDAEVARIVAAARPALLFDEAGAHALDGGRPVPRSIALAIATSGTTGTPKIVQLSHDALRHTVTASLHRLGGRGDAWTCCLPVTHMGGMLVMLRTMIGGGALRFNDGSPEALSGGHGFVSLVPTMLSRAIAAGADLSAYRAIVVGGDALAPEVAARAGAPVVATYGMTETCGGVVYDGRPLDGVTAATDDDQILIGGPTLMDGYIGGAPPGRWFRTGDAGSVVDGRVTVFGRLDDRITTGGEKVYPAEVEHVLRSFPGVLDAVVTGLPDPTWGARVVARVEVADDQPPIDLVALEAFVRANLARHKVPKTFSIGPIARTAAGTIDRTAAHRHGG